MEIQDKSDPNELLKGQLWGMVGQYLLVMDVGKRFIHYRLLRSPEQRVAAVKIANRLEVANFLIRRNAKLVSTNINIQASSGI